MRDRVKEILSPDVLKLIKQKEGEGCSRYNLISAMIVHTDKTPKEILKECGDDKENVTAYQNTLIIAIMTGIGIKEEATELQHLLKKTQKESEE